MQHIRKSYVVAQQYIKTSRNNWSRTLRGQRNRNAQNIWVGGSHAHGAYTWHGRDGIKSTTNNNRFLLERSKKMLWKILHTIDDTHSQTPNLHHLINDYAFTSPATSVMINTLLLVSQRHQWQQAMPMFNSMEILATHTRLAAGSVCQPPSSLRIGPSSVVMARGPFWSLQAVATCTCGQCPSITIRTVFFHNIRDRREHEHFRSFIRSFNVIHIMTQLVRRTRDHWWDDVGWGSESKCRWFVENVPQHFLTTVWQKPIIVCCWLSAIGRVLYIKDVPRGLFVINRVPNIGRFINK